MKAAPLTVLIIEDQPLMRAALSSTLSAENLNVVSMPSMSQDVVTTIQSLHPDLILFSIGNSAAQDMAWMQTLRRRFPSTHIVALLTGEIPGEDRTALQHGASLTVLKTASRSMILNAISPLLTRKHQAANVHTAS